MIPMAIPEMKTHEMKHKKRLYELTVVIPIKGKPPVEKKMMIRGIDSIHASAEVIRMFGRRKVKVISAVPVKD